MSSLLRRDTRLVLGLPVRRGWLMIRDLAKPEDKMKKYWVILTEYFIHLSDTQAAKAPMLSFAIDDVFVAAGSMPHEFAMPESLPGLFLFRLSTSHRTYLVGSKDTTETNAWITSIVQVQAERVHSPESPIDVLQAANDEVAYTAHVTGLDTDPAEEEPVYVVEVNAFSEVWTVKRSLMDWYILAQRLASMAHLPAFFGDNSFRPRSSGGGSSRRSASQRRSRAADIALELMHAPLSPLSLHAPSNLDLRTWQELRDVVASPSSIEYTHLQNSATQCERMFRLRFLRNFLHELTTTSYTELQQHDVLFDFLEIRSLFRAVRNGSLEHLDFLKEVGVSFMDKTLATKRTALHIAALHPDEGAYVIETLIGCGIDINAQDIYGDTALSLSMQTPEQRLRRAETSLSELEDGAEYDANGEEVEIRAKVKAMKEQEAKVLEQAKATPANTKAQWRPSTGDIELVNSFHLPESLLGQPVMLKPSVRQLGSTFKMPITTSTVGIETGEHGGGAGKRHKLLETPIDNPYVKHPRPFTFVSSQLLNAHCNVNTVNNEGRSAFHYAVETSDKAVVEALYFAHGSLNAADLRGFSVLHCAVAANRPRIVSHLLLKKTSINTELADAKGRTPLLLAACFSYADIVTMLLRAGASITKRDKHGHSALFYGVLGRNAQVVDAVLQYRGNADEVDAAWGCTALTLAIETHNIEVVSVLLKRGADMLKEDEKGRTPVQVALKEHHLDMVRFLKTKGIDLNRPDRYNKNRSTLHHAVTYAFAAGVEYLLKEKVDVNGVDSGQNTPLHLLFAAKTKEKNKLAILKMLLRAGANINACDAKGQSVFFVAVYNGVDRSMLKELVRKEADANIARQDGKTPLLIAAEAGDRSIVEYLVKNSLVSNLDAVDATGNGALHYAVANEHASIAVFLAHSKASLRLKNAKGKTPLDLASSVVKSALADIENGGDGRSVSYASRRSAAPPPSTKSSRRAPR